MRALALAAALLTAAPAMAAEGRATCAYLGPLALSAHVDFMVSVAVQERAKATEAAARLATFLELTERLSCDPAPTIAAIDCLTERLRDGATGKPADVAAICLRENGFE